MRQITIVLGSFLMVATAGLAPRGAAAGLPPAPQTSSSPAATKAPAPDEIDRLLAPVALYPDQLLAQIFLCASDPAGVTALSQFLKSNSTLKGTELQDAAVRDNFEPSFVALAPFGQVVNMMAADIDWTTRLGKAFTANRSAVFGSIQRLRTQAQKAGTLKTTPQQEVETQTTSSGEQVIVIEPANPQVVYVPQYNPATVYAVPTTTTTTVVVQEDNSAEVAAAGLIGFTAGIAIGAAIDNDYYYGPYGWHGSPYMYNDGWDDYYDARDDARDDWTDHREDVIEERGDRAENTQEQRTDRQENRQENRPEAQEQRTERQQTRQENSPESQAQRQERATQAKTNAAQTKSSSGATSASRGYSGTRTAPTTQTQRGTSSDAFSGYSSGKSERAASSRGQSSRSSSRGGGGGGRRR